MAQTTSREVRKALRRLDDGDRRKVLKFAKSLHKSGGPEGRESLAENDGRPSYLAVAGEQEYLFEKKHREAGGWG